MDVDEEYIQKKIFTNQDQELKISEIAQNKQNR